MLNQQKLKITPYIIIPLFTMVIFIISLLLSKFYLIIYKKVDKNDFMENKICNIIKRLSEWKTCVIDDLIIIWYNIRTNLFKGVFDYEN